MTGYVVFDRMKLGGEVEPGKVEPLTKEDKLPAIAESGFAFDPAEALCVYDPELIHSEDLRENTVRELKAMGCIQREDGKLEMPIGNAHEQYASNAALDNVDNAPDTYGERQKAMLPEGLRIDDEPGKRSRQPIANRFRHAIEANRKAYEKTAKAKASDEYKAGIGQNVLVDFSPGPVREALCDSILEGLKLCQRFGILGVRGIMRVPGSDGNEWEKQRLAQNHRGILCLNERKIRDEFYFDAENVAKIMRQHFQGKDRVRNLVLHEFGHQLCRMI